VKSAAETSLRKRNGREFSNMWGLTCAEAQFKITFVGGTISAHLLRYVSPEPPKLTIAATQHEFADGTSYL
jgi:hypothetical protein